MYIRCKYNRKTKNMTVNTDEYAKFYQSYIDKVDTEKTIVKNLQETFQEAMAIFKVLPEDKYLYKYAEKKWTIVQLLEHIIDAERIFSYRALRFARNDKTDLPGFEENSYVENAYSNSRDYQELLEEFVLVRKASEIMFSNFSDEVLKRTGSIDGNKISVRAIGYVNAGHLRHHLAIIKERYL